jgi:hypothetical protein
VAQLLDKHDGVKRTEMMWRRIIHSAFRCGGEANAARLLATAADPQVPQPVREEALRLMATWAKPFPVDQSIGYWAPLPVLPKVPFEHGEVLLDARCGAGSYSETLQQGVQRFCWEILSATLGGLRSLNRTLPCCGRRRVG